ncbi:hypothetical protein AB0F17_35105 [Nonomuraea sp. NPDC026600]|uniref:hypothetical protein n=1 Tax=Nonomuraea sp. NPDC026600 TaxID=3155363 RepID=UPI0033CAE5BD
MGAHDFTTYAHGINASSAYAAAVEEAVAENGHSRHNGTISTTDGFIVLDDTPRPMNDALEVARQKLDDPRIEKRGFCGAIPVLGTRRDISAPIPAVPGGYRTRDEAADAALAPYLREGESVDRYYLQMDVILHADTDRIVSGSVRAPVEGGEKTHAGWLFFGMAAS